MRHAQRSTRNKQRRQNREKRFEYNVVPDGKKKLDFESYYEYKNDYISTDIQISGSVVGYFVLIGGGFMWGLGNTAVSTVGMVLFIIALVIVLSICLSACCICPNHYVRNNKKLPDGVSQDDIVWVNVP